MKRLKVGIVGLGRIAALYEKDKKAQKYYPFLTHAGSYAKCPDAELFCGADIDRAKLAKFKDMFAVKKLYTDYKKMLKENDLDILSICTHPDSHYEIIKAASGKVKVIFCEKPFTKGSGQINRIIASGRKLPRISINVYREYDVSHMRVRDMIISKKYGKAQRVNCFYGKGLRNMGSHLLAYLIGTLGSPEKIRVFGKRSYKGSKEATYDVYMLFPKDIPVILQSCDYEHYRLFEIDFICERGRIQILDEGLTIKVFEKRNHKAETGAYELSENISAIKSTVGSSIGRAIDYLVRMAHDRSIPPLVSPERYMAVQRVIEEIEKQGRKL